MLDPAPQPLQPVFERDFAGMPREPVALETLERAREQLIAAIHARLDDASVAFLSSIETESPDWDALGLPHVARLPGMRRKLQNLGARNPAKRAADRRRFDDCIRRRGARRPQVRTHPARGDGHVEDVLRLKVLTCMLPEL